MKHAASAVVATANNPGFTPQEARDFYPDGITMREARERYFQRAGFSAASYVDPWLFVPFAGRVVRLPNLKARRDAVRVHDLNHVIGGFGTDWLGEAMIGGFELGMGAGQYWIAWMLDATALSVGLVRAPGAVIKSFARGRAARASTFAVIPDVTAPEYEAILDSTVGEFRARIGAPDHADVTVADVLKLAGYTVGGWCVVPLIMGIALGTAIHGVVSPPVAEA